MMYFSLTSNSAMQFLEFEQCPTVTFVEDESVKTEKPDDEISTEREIRIQKQSANPEPHTRSPVCLPKMWNPDRMNSSSLHAASTCETGKQFNLETA